MFKSMVFDGGKIDDFKFSGLEQSLISDILAEHDIESCFVVGRRRNSPLDCTDMDRYIKLRSERYTIIVSLARIDYDDISSLAEKIESETIFWENFQPLEKLWYADGMKYLRCLSADHNNETLIFE